MEKLIINKSKFEPVKTMLVVFGCVLVNFLGKRFAAALALPLWLDCVGTVFAAYVLGPVSGAVVGCTCNIIYSFWNANSLIYGITSIFVGISTGIAARKKYFETFFKSASLAGGVTIGSVLISTVLNLLLYGGNTGNLWGDGVRDYLLEKGLSGVLASAVGELYLDFLDKVVTVLLLYCLIKVGRTLRGRRRIKRGIAAALALLLCAGTLSLSADAANIGNASEAAAYLRHVYDADNALPCGHANDVAQTNNGILWVGTNAGLFRYNGSSFHFMDSYDAVKNVNCLYVDQEGRLWIGTKDNGLVLAINEKIANTLDSANGLPSDSVRSIVQSADGNYYVCTSSQMAVVRITSGIKVTRTLEEVYGGLYVAADKEGNVAAVTENGGLYILKDQAVRYAVAAPEGAERFSACAFDENGILYAGTSDGRIRTYRLVGSRAMETANIRCEGAERINQISFLAGCIWVLSDSGIGLLNRNVYQRVDTGGFDSSVERMTVDYQGNLWFASATRGLLQLSETRFPNVNTETGLPAEAVQSTCVKDGTLYIGTAHGLTAVALASGKPVGNLPTVYLADTPINCIQTDSVGNLWICSSGKGLIRFAPDGTIKTYGEESGVGSTAYLCTVLSDGTIAVSGECGLALIGAETVQTIPFGDLLGTAQILSICEHPDGRILLGTDGNGIVAVRSGRVVGHLTKAYGLPSGVVRRIVRDSAADILYIVTGNSLCYMENNAIWQILDFPYSDNYDVIPDDDGEVFVLGSSGIFVVRKEALLSGTGSDRTLLDSKAGFQGALTKNAYNALAKNKNLYLSTDRGVVLMNLDAYRPEKRSYRLMVSAIKLDGKTVPIERGSGLTIGRDINNIEFIPEIVNYFPDNPKVSYYLEGIDSGYKTVAQNDLSGIVYTNLASGEYTFHLALIDEESGNVREESTYGFIKEKSIYDNAWFLIYMLVVGGLFIGWLAWFLTKRRALRTLAAQQEKLALALKQVQMGNETILAIAKTVDAKDSMTSQHSQRVSEYSVLISEKLGFSAAERENLRKAALLHDIGKIGIPDSILNKPDRLADKEYAVMKTHVTRGAEILKDFTLIEHVVEGAKYHHERYDGCGYPDGLKGGDIPLYGRIIAIADAFDAMTANRVYRKRLAFSLVLEELRKGRGTQFDPELLDLFLAVIDSGGIDTEALYADEAPEEKEAAAHDA